MPRKDERMDNFDSVNFKVESNKISDNNYRALAVAIVQQTCMDYMSAWKANHRSDIHGSTNTSCEKTIVQAEKFFRERLWLYLNDATIDPEIFIEKLRSICNDPLKVSEIGRRTIPFA